MLASTLYVSGKPRAANIGHNKLCLHTATCAMPCRAVLCHVVLCHAMPCPAIITDKNPVLREFATEVSKIINEAVARLEHAKQQ